MIGYSETEVFTDDELRAWRAVSRWIECVPTPSIVMRCHELARASLFVLRTSKLHKISETAKIEDGKYGMVEHSWIRLDHRTILDTYACGKMPMVQLISQLTTLPHFDLYKPGPERDDINQTMLDWLNFELTIQLNPKNRPVLDWFDPKKSEP